MATGDLDKTMLRRHIRGIRRQVRHCYNRALLRDPSAEGTVRVRWTIHEDGGVTNVTAASEIDDDELSACIVRAHQKLRFPAARGGGLVQVHYPYAFVPPRRYDDKLSVADEGNVLAHYVESGSRAEADKALAEIEEELSGKPPRALLPYLAPASVRRRYGAKFRRAALDRLEQPSPPIELWVAFTRSLARDEPSKLEIALGARELDAWTAAAILQTLMRDGHRDRAAEVARAWHNGPLSSEHMLRVFENDDSLQQALPARWFLILSRVVDSRDDPGFALDSLVDVAASLGMDRHAADKILARCEVDSPACRNWLRAELDDPRLRLRLESNLEPRIAALTAARATAADIDELVAMLRLLGRDAEAERIDSEHSDLSAWDR